MKHIRATRLLILLSCGLYMFSFAACNGKNAAIPLGDAGPFAIGGPPPHAPAHGYRAKHVYYYYPDSYVYFDISRKAYFYLEGGIWRMSVSLPHNLHVRLDDHVVIEMNSPKPYTHFKSHKKKYPPGQVKKKEKWVKKKRK